MPAGLTERRRGSETSAESEPPPGELLSQAELEEALQTRVPEPVFVTATAEGGDCPLSNATEKDTAFGLIPILGRLLMFKKTETAWGVLAAPAAENERDPM